MTAPKSSTAPDSSEAEGATAESPDAPDPAFGRWLFAQRCDFVAGVAQMDQLPAFDLPEVAFAGRSNVGKSSLINALTGRKTLARTSNTPGRTRQLNFFDLGGRLMLVDLPGHGYAKAPKVEIRRWTELTRDYLHGRPTLQRVYLLIDARRGLQDGDEAVMSALDSAAVSYQVVWTKADKASADERTAAANRLDARQRAHVALHPVAHVTSAMKQTGLAALRADVAALG